MNWITTRLLNIFYKTCYAFAAMMVCFSAAPVNPASATPLRTVSFIDKSPADLEMAPGRILSLRHVQRIIFPVLIAGRATFPTSSQVFMRMYNRTKDPDLLASVISASHKRGLSVYAYIDCLNWSENDHDAKGPLSRHHDLTEIANGKTNFDDSFASPFNPTVRQALIDLVAELANKHPAVDGLVIRCDLAPHSLLGFSIQARSEYIRATQIDPIDIVDIDHPERSREAHNWAQWRMVQVGSLVQAISKTFKEHSRDKPVAAVGSPLWYKQSLDDRDCSLSDWLDWVKVHAINEIIFVCDWSQPENAGVYKSATHLLSRMSTSTNVSVLMQTQSPNGQSLDPLMSFANQDFSPTTSFIINMTSGKIIVFDDFWRVLDTSTSAHSYKATGGLRQ